MPITAVLRLCLTVAFFASVTPVSLPAETPLIEQGRAAIARSDTDAAIALLEKAVAESPDSAEAHFYLGNAYGIAAQRSGMLAGAKYAKKVKAEFERAVALNPKYVDAHFGLVEFYAIVPGIMGGSDAKALQHAKQIKAIDPLLGHRAYSVIYAQQKKLDLAKKELTDALAEQPNSPKAHSYLGQYLSNVEKNYPAAFSEFETVLKVDPTYMAAYYHLGRTAATSETNLARGEEGLKKYLTHTPKENEPTLASAHYYLGAIYEKQGKKAEARQSYQAALKLNPGLKRASEALKRIS